METNLENIKFASLFHDIGKFYQRKDSTKHSYDAKYKRLSQDDFGFNGAHGKWSADFVKEFYDDLIEDLVLYHHNPKNSSYPDLCKLIQKADHHSSSERIKRESKQEVSKTPLISIFSRIDNNKEWYIPLKELTIENNSVYPTSHKEMGGWNLQPDYNDLWNKFINEFGEIKNHNDFETVLALFKKYTSTIPSAAYVDESDISLYDHSKTTVAIANCRYFFKESGGKGKEVYKIINGDISGIQKFIYRISSPEDAQSGMSKRLRGRSLYLTLLLEAIVAKLINDLGLDSSNILFCGGGRFIIIAPNTDKTEEVINNLSDEINRFFIKKFNSELYLSLVSKNINGDDLENFGNVISDLNGLLNNDKKHKFINNLEDVFKIEDEINYDKVCVVCGNKLDDDDSFCSECLKHEDLGKSVANAEYMIKYTSDFEIKNSDFFIDFLNVGFIFKNYQKDVIKLLNENKDVSFVVYRLNNTDFLDIQEKVKNENVSYDFKFFGNNVPNIQGEPLYFEHLAKISKGANKLGVLKMDVDNLGMIFSQGFNSLTDKEDDFKGSSISRISSLSFYLDLFFSGVINKIIENYKVYPDCGEFKDKFDAIKLDFEDKTREVYKLKDGEELPAELENTGTSTIYINYSGGDDLLVLGPYDDIISFAKEFRTKFKQWTSCNDSINISGGIVITGPKFPIGKAAIMADEELEKSKDCGRDKLTVFNQVLSWQSEDKVKGFDDLFKLANKLEKLKEDNKISMGFVYSLLNIWESRSKVKPMYIFNEEEWENQNIKKISSKSYVPALMYKLRLIKDSKLRDELAKEGVKFLPWIKTPVSWVSLRLR